MTTATAKSPTKKRRAKRSPRGQGVRFQKINAAVRRGQDVIESGSTYSIAVFCRKTGLGPDAVREYRTRGLKVRRVGNQLYVAGSDWLDWLKTQPTE